MKKFVICLAALLTCSLFTAEQPPKKPKPNEQQPALQQPQAQLSTFDQFLELPLELQQRILYGNATTLQEAVAFIQATMQVNTFWRNVINNQAEVAHIIKLLAQNFNVTIPLAAVSLGTTAAKTWLDNYLVANPHLFIALQYSLQEALCMYTGSNQSTQVIREIVKRCKPIVHEGRSVRKKDGSFIFLERKGATCWLSSINYLATEYTTKQITFPEGFANPDAETITQCKNGDMIILCLYTTTVNFNIIIHAFAIRYKPDGTRDTTFGQNGSLTFENPLASNILKFIELPDETLVAIGGSSINGRPIIIKFSSAGSLINYDVTIGADKTFTNIRLGTHGNLIVLGTQNFFSMPTANYAFVKQYTPTLAPIRQWQLPPEAYIMTTFLCETAGGNIALAGISRQNAIVNFTVYLCNPQDGTILHEMRVPLNVN